jgi:hypothetical protein
MPAPPGGDSPRHQACVTRLIFSSYATPVAVSDWGRTAERRLSFIDVLPNCNIVDARRK